MTYQQAIAVVSKDPEVQAKAKEMNDAHDVWIKDLEEYHTLIVTKIKGMNTPSTSV